MSPRNAKPETGLEGYTGCVKEIKHLGEVHRRAARMVFEGLPNKDIAKACGVTAHRITIWRGSRVFKKHMDELQSVADAAVTRAPTDVGESRATALEIVMGKAELAAQRLTDMLKDDNWNKLRASDKLGVVERCFRALGIDKQGGAGTAVQIVIQQSDLDRAVSVRDELTEADILPG